MKTSRLLLARPYFGFVGFEEMGDEQEQILLAQHLLVAADRYILERLKMMCVKLLHIHLNVNNVVSTFSIADRYNCTELRAACLALWSIPASVLFDLRFGS